jgi:orotidine-5'-phosphate decarboxylase
LHDIPTTVRGAAHSISAAHADIVTVHALGGPSMVAAACEALPDAEVAAVTMLTSMTPDDMANVGVSGAPLAAVVRLARLAVNAGARAVVCSPREVGQVREVVGPDVRLITPGVRPVGAAAGDQHRVATPAQALADGADLLVIGRPITASPHPATAAAEIASDIAASG